MEISRRSRQKFADLAAVFGVVRTIQNAYENEGFDLPANYEYPEHGVRRSLCSAFEEGIDLGDATVTQRLLRTYLEGVEEWGQRSQPFSLADATDRDMLVKEARALVRSLQRDGAPVDEDGNLVLGATPTVLAVERFDRLKDPRALLEHLDRIDAGIATDPAAAIGSAKELTETVCKFVLNDYGVNYSQGADLPELYKLVATELRLTRESVPESAKGSQSAQKVLQNMVTAVQCLAELRNELGLGHGRTAPSPALARHGRLAANAARTVVEFVLDTWHERKRAAAA